ncbi:MAG: SCO family protein [Anaerolineales bacterium]
MLRVGFGLLALIGLTGLLVIFFQRPAQLRGGVLNPALPAENFTLTRHDGSQFELAQYRGKIVLLFFGYTSCPDVCPATMAELRQAISELDEEDAAQVQVVFVAVDPDRDTPERIQEYVGHFHPDFIGLSGSLDELQTVWNAYGVYREVEESDSALGYLVSHTARVYLIDKAGNLRLAYAFGTPPDDIAHDLKILVQE